MKTEHVPVSKGQEAHLFYEAIGKAVTNWQLVEDVLGIIFLHLMSNSAAIMPVA
jgi:hypothetical protein